MFQAVSRKQGRPLSGFKKPCLARKTKPNISVNSTTQPILWSAENTAFGTVFKGPNNEIVLPPGMFEKIEEQFENLSTS